MNYIHKDFQATSPVVIIFSTQAFFLKCNPLKYKKQSNYPNLHSLHLGDAPVNS